MGEIEDLISKAERKYEVGRLVYNSGYYAESIDHFYYSMYCVAKALLLKKGIAPKTHAGTINMIQVHYVETGELDSNLHSSFSNAQTLREQVDYDATDDISHHVAREKRNVCGEFIKSAKEILDL